MTEVDDQMVQDLISGKATASCPATQQVVEQAKNGEISFAELKAALAGKRLQQQGV